MLVAPQEFKGTLTAVEAAEAIATALRRQYAGWQFDVLPMADGGPGTTDALLAALGGERRTARVSDPHLRTIEADWGLLPGNRAVLECAAASGLLRLKPQELTPEGVQQASSRGTGGSRRWARRWRFRRTRKWWIWGKRRSCQGWWIPTRTCFCMASSMTTRC